ncbi:hypothetical protein HPB50_002891 [Hyalomma asiaticum]|uniref:Uncharacterized protein n=1 Tax=Hyalomma asiaticum TaxID=266040 RepID=A0ACB7THQ9_HYAAI|nr:hypothetical protein HPB50_002891 [Hyalomma asiaticum]
MESEIDSLNKLWRTLPTRLRQLLWTLLRLRLPTMARRPLPTMKALLGCWCKRKDARKPTCSSLNRSNALRRANFTARPPKHKPMRSQPPLLPLHDYKAILRPLGGLRFYQWTRPALTRAIGVAAGLPPVEVDRLVFHLRSE